MYVWCVCLCVHGLDHVWSMYVCVCMGMDVCGVRVHGDRLCVVCVRMEIDCVCAWR